MTTETMTIHKALSEAKIIDDRINDAIRAIKSCSYKKHSAINVDGISSEQFSELARSRYQKAIDLIKRRDAIKRAINQSNAATKIVVAGREMTVAESIYEQKYGLDMKRKLLQKLINDYNNALDKIRYENEQNLEEKLEQHIRDTFGSKDKADPKALEEARRVFVENSTFELIDPIGVNKEIERLRDEIDSFAVEVDSAQQTSNATTMITIEY